MYFWGYASYYLAHLDNTSNIAFLPLKYIARIYALKDVRLLYPVIMNPKAVL